MPRLALGPHPATDIDLDHRAIDRELIHQPGLGKVKRPRIRRARGGIHRRDVPAGCCGPEIAVGIEPDLQKTPAGVFGPGFVKVPEVARQQPRRIVVGEGARQVSPRLDDVVLELEIVGPIGQSHLRVGLEVLGQLRAAGGDPDRPEIGVHGADVAGLADDIEAHESTLQNCRILQGRQFVGEHRRTRSGTGGIRAGSHTARVGVVLDRPALERGEVEFVADDDLASEGIHPVGFPTKVVQPDLHPVEHSLRVARQRRGRPGQQKIVHLIRVADDVVELVVLGSQLRMGDVEVGLSSHGVPPRHVGILILLVVLRVDGIAAEAAGAIGGVFENTVERLPLHGRRDGDSGGGENRGGQIDGGHQGV